MCIYSFVSLLNKFVSLLKKNKGEVSFFFLVSSPAFLYKQECFCVDRILFADCAKSLVITYST